MADLQDLKAQAVAYFEQNKVPMRMQDALNLMFHANPADVNGFVSSYFEELAIVPTISRVIALRTLDTKGQPAITVKLYCIKRNKEVLAAESNISFDSKILENSKVEDKESEDSERAQEIDNAINLINNEFRDILISANPKDLQTLDDQLYEFVETKRLQLLEQEKLSSSEEATSPAPTQDDGKKGGKKSGKGGSAKKKGAQVVIVPDNPVEKSYPGSYAVTSVSQVLGLAGASLSSTPLFDYLLTCYGCDNFSIKLPLPIITLCQSGKAGLGKNNIIKEYMIVPREDMLTSEAITLAAQIQESIMKPIYTKTGISIKNYSDTGALCPTIDKVEQGLDMITETVSQAGFEMGKDFFFILNASAQECFDYEKGKYEVITGMLKSPDDMADFWLDICNRYPSIVGLIDPLRSEEQEQWNKICSSISERCLVITQRGYSRPGLLKEENIDFFQFATSGVMMKLESSTTISDLVRCSKRMSDLNNTVILMCGQHETNDTTIIDVAIACQARFVKIGAPVRGERVVKYNHLIDIENQLGERHAFWPTLTFPTIPPKPPTPTPDPIEGDTGDVTDE